MQRFDPPFAVNNLDELAVTLARPRQARWVTSEQAWFVYEHGSDDHADDKFVIQPLIQPGRWVRKTDYDPYSV